MAIVALIEYEDASPEVRAVYDDIRATRKVEWINNFWKGLASHPPTLERVWRDVKTVMAPGALDPLTKEMVYITASIINGCSYCVHSHTAAATAKGMTREQHAELVSIVALAAKTNQLATALQVPVDPEFDRG